MVGTRQPKYYLQGSANYSTRDFWTLSSDYEAPAGSLQPGGRRLSSDSKDSRFNFKAGFTPNDSDEYTLNYTQQSGEKGAPLNIFNNPPVPPNSFWRWPWWDVRNTSLLTKTALGTSSYLKTKLYYNTFENGLDAFDDGTYTTQSANGRLRSPYDDHAYGVSVELGTTPRASNTLKTALHYRSDVHTEQNFNRPTHPTLSTVDPKQERSQYTWSAAVEDTIHITPTVDLVGGVSFEKYEVTKAESFTAAAGLFEFPKGGADSFNGQGAAIWHYAANAQFYASVSDRSRFPVLFELYSTRFGSATPNPDLGPERATNLEIGWKGTPSARLHVEGAVFYSDVRDLAQTVTLPDGTQQTQNVGDGHFVGGEIAVEVQAGRNLAVGGNYTGIKRTIEDPLQPSFEPTGVPTHKGFLYASWKPIDRLTITPSIDAASDRWSDRNPPAFSFVQTGAYTLVNLSAEYEVTRGLGIVGGFKNMTDDYYELAWGLPQPGRTFYVKMRPGM